MNRREFFTQLFGEEPNGWICVRGIYFNRLINAEKPPYHVWVSNFDEADAAIAQFEKEGREAYYVPGLFKEKGDKYNGASVVNVKSHRSFYVDIDCGADAKKPYKTQKEGLAALQKFLDQTGLPMPTLVSSGYGIHCYWVVDKDVSYDLWKPIAMSLKEKGHYYGFKTDQRVVGDGASLLRPPDGVNTKDPENAKKVKVKYAAPVMTLEQFSKIIPPVLTHTNVSATDALTASLMGDYPPSSFEHILTKSRLTKAIRIPVKKVTVDKDGVEQVTFKEETIEACSGCQQIKKCYEEREYLDYDMWLLALSVAQFCTDSDTAIHVISEGHPDYDLGATIKKAATLHGGPATCLKFQQQNPDGCIGCIHRQQGKIKGPIALGYHNELSTASDLVMENVLHEGFSERTTVEAPLQYPAPWARPRRGGIVRRDFDDIEQAEEAGESMETFVYGNDLWVKQLLQDDDDGASIHMVHVQPFGPHDKRVVEFMIPYEDVAKKDALTKHLAHYGVHGVFTQAVTVLLQQYIQAWVCKLEKETKPGIARAHYGWHGSNFVVGKREYSAQNPWVYSPPSRATAHTADAFDASGELVTWSQMANLYDAVGNEAKAFTLFLSFGAPLYKFLELGSCLVHLSNKDSGVGKSTNQKVGASVWGDPKELMLLKTDTENARYHQFGIMRNLPIWIDEITNMDTDELSELAYRISENRGKHRQYSHSNALRKNQTRWETIVISSGNNNIYETLQQNKISLGGEINRIIQLDIEVKDSLTQEEASYWYEQVLPNNFGTAGHIYAQYLVDAEEEIKEEITRVYLEYVQKFNFTREQRFYRGVCAAAFTGARIAKALGIHNIDIERVEAWAIAKMGSISENVVDASHHDSLQVLGQFLNEHKQNELILNHGRNQAVAGGLQMPEMPIKEPTRKLMIRRERDVHRLYIAASSLRAWCSERRVPYEGLVADIKQANMLISARAFKDLGEGTSSTGTPVVCVVVDLERLGRIDDALADGAKYPVQ